MSPVAEAFVAAAYDVRDTTPRQRVIGHGTLNVIP